MTFTHHVGLHPFIDASGMRISCFQLVNADGRAEALVDFEDGRVYREFYAARVPRDVRETFRAWAVEQDRTLVPTRFEARPVYTLPRLALKESEFLDALFKGPKTFDGFVRKVDSQGVHFWFRRHELCMNRHRVVCYKSKRDDGRTVYRFTNTDEWPYSLSQTDDLFSDFFAPLLTPNP